MRIYYLLWVDCIVRARSQPSNEKNWPIITMALMTIPMVGNMVVLIGLLEYYVIRHSFYEIDIEFLPDEMSNVVSYIVLFILPWTFLNYLLIFRKQRYIKLIERYPYHNGNYFLVYFTLSIFLPLIVIWGGYYLEL